MAASKKKVSKKTASKKKVASRKKAVLKKEVPVTKGTLTEASTEEVEVKPVSPEPVISEMLDEVEPEEVDETYANDENESKVEEPATAREKAAASRKVLFNQLQSDFDSGIDSILAAGDAVKRGVKLFGVVAVDEFAVAREKVSAVVSRDGSLLNAGQQKSKNFLFAGERWGKQQFSKAKETAEKIRRKVKK